MTAPEWPDRSEPSAPTEPESAGAPSGHGRHGWMMIACCIPMLLIAIVLVATGVASAGFILVAIMCTAMMWMMMRGMSGSGGR
jgi:hypothetical protein